MVVVVVVVVVVEVEVEEVGCESRVFVVVVEGDGSEASELRGVDTGEATSIILA